MRTWFINLIRTWRLLFNSRPLRGFWDGRGRRTSRRRRWRRCGEGGSTGWATGPRPRCSTPVGSQRHSCLTWDYFTSDKTEIEPVILSDTFELDANVLLLSWYVTFGLTSIPRDLPGMITRMRKIISEFSQGLGDNEAYIISARWPNRYPVTKSKLPKRAIWTTYVLKYKHLFSLTFNPMTYRKV